MLEVVWQADIDRHAVERHTQQDALLAVGVHAMNEDIDPYGAETCVLNDLSQ
jgi:hypothetical protein